MPRGKRKATEFGSSSVPSLDDRFPSEHYRLKFFSTKYVPLACRHIDRSFFSLSCPSIVEIITYYGLEKFLYCDTNPNIDKCAEFYNNLVEINDLAYTTKVGGQDLYFSPETLGIYLGLRQSSCTFVCYPPKDLPFDDPYSHITLDTMYSHFFGQDRDPAVTLFQSTQLHVQDYVLYRVVVNCLLPMSSRDITLMRPYHTFLVYAFRHRLELDLSLLLFRSIIHHSRVVTSRKTHMPFCHVITSLLHSLGCDMTSGHVKPLGEFDRIGLRNLKLAQIGIDRHHVIFWKRDRVGQAQPEADLPGQADEPGEPDEDDVMPDIDVTDIAGFDALPAPPLAPTLEEQISSIRESLASHRIDVGQRLDRLEQQQDAILELLRTRLPPPPPPPPSD